MRAWEDGQLKIYVSPSNWVNDVKNEQSYLQCISIAFGRGDFLIPLLRAEIIRRDLSYNAFHRAQRGALRSFIERSLQTECSSREHSARWVPQFSRRASSTSAALTERYRYSWTEPLWCLYSLLLSELSSADVQLLNHVELALRSEVADVAQRRDAAVAEIRSRQGVEMDAVVARRVLLVSANAVAHGEVSPRALNSCQTSGDELHSDADTQTDPRINSNDCNKVSGCGTFKVRKFPKRDGRVSSLSAGLPLEKQSNGREISNPCFPGSSGAKLQDEMSRTVCQHAAELEALESHWNAKIVAAAAAARTSYVTFIDQIYNQVLNCEGGCAIDEARIPQTVLSALRGLVGEQSASDLQGSIQTQQESAETLWGRIRLHLPRSATFLSGLWQPKGAPPENEVSGTRYDSVPSTGSCQAEQQIRSQQGLTVPAVEEVQPRRLLGLNFLASSRVRLRPSRGHVLPSHFLSIYLLSGAFPFSSNHNTPSSAPSASTLSDILQRHATLGFHGPCGEGRGYNAMLSYSSDCIHHNASHYRHYFHGSVSEPDGDVTESIPSCLFPDVSQNLTLAVLLTTATTHGAVDTSSLQFTAFRSLCDACGPDLLFPPLLQQVGQAMENLGRVTIGDVLFTRHSSIPGVHIVAHLVIRSLADGGDETSSVIPTAALRGLAGAVGVAEAAKCTSILLPLQLAEGAYGSSFVFKNSKERAAAVMRCVRATLIDLLNKAAAPFAVDGAHLNLRNVLFSLPSVSVMSEFADSAKLSSCVLDEVFGLIATIFGYG